VIPNEHIENLYEIDDDLLGAVYATAWNRDSRTWLKSEPGSG
jgi:hypothetical protein